MADQILVNKNPLQPTKYRLLFDRLPGATYMCQSVSLPGLSLQEATVPNPFIDLFVPGDKMTYDPLEISFMVDEELVAWKQIHDWIRGMAFPKDFSEYTNLKNLSAVSNLRNFNRVPPQYSDGSLNIYTSKNNLNYVIKFKDLFPTSLTRLTFAAGDNANDIIHATALFRFSYYEMVKA